MDNKNFPAPSSDKPDEEIQSDLASGLPANQPSSPAPTQPTTIQPQIITPTGADNPARSVAAPASQPQIDNPPPNPPANTPTYSAAVPPQTASAPQPAVQNFAPETEPQNTPVVGGSFETPVPMAGVPATPEVAPSPGRKRKKLLIIGGVSFFLAICLTGSVFAFYLPNTPKRVWSSGLNNTAKEADQVIKRLQDPKSYKTLETSSILLKGTASIDSTNIKVNLDSKYDSTKSSSNFDLNATDGTKNYKINAQIKTILPDAATFPNVYFKVSGLSSLGLDALLGNTTKYDNKWIAVEQDYYASIIKTETADKQDNKNITQKDVTGIISDLNTVAKEYVFTDNPDKAVIEMVSYVGNEKSEGITAKHYKARVNKQHAAAYCKASTEKLFSNQSFKRIIGANSSDYQQYKQDALKSCDEQAKNSEISKPFDMWIDNKYKLVHKVRVYEDFAKSNKDYEKQKADCEQDSKAAGSDPSQCSSFDYWIKKGQQYSEFGQVYKDKGVINLFAHESDNVNSAKTDTRIDLALNYDKLSLAGKIKYSSSSKDGGDSRADITVVSKPYSGKIDAEKPAGAIPLQQVLNDLGFSQ